MKRMLRIRRSQKTGQVISFTWTKEQIRLRKLYELDEQEAKLGPSMAIGPLDVGSLLQDYDPAKHQATFKKKKEVVPFTTINLANAFGYIEQAMQYFFACMLNGHTPPDLVVSGTYMAAKSMFNNEVVIPMRRYFNDMGFEGVKCYFYCCPTIEQDIDPDTGKADFKYSTEQPLCVVPYSLNQAQKKWSISEDLAKELALTAGLICFKKMKSLRLIHTLDEAIESFGDWREALPYRKRVFAYLEGTIWPRALLGAGSPDD